MGLDFIDISQSDGQERVRASGGRKTSKSNEKINQSVFLDMNEDTDIEAAIYRSMSRKAAVNGNPDGIAVRKPNKSIVNIDVSRTETRRRSGGESPDRDNVPPDRRRRSSTSDRGGNPAPRRRPETVDRQRRKAAEEKARREREIRRKRRQRKQALAKLTVLLFMVFVVGLLLFMLIKLVKGEEKSVDAVKRIENVSPVDSAERREVIKTNKTQKPMMEEDFLTVNEYSRPGEKLGKVNNIFVHYTANKGTSAAQNRSYFENLGITGETSASAHFIIGFEGEIVQCIPLEEIAYAVQKRNYDSISIECCFLQDDGKFTDATYQSLIRLCAWLLNEYDLAPEDMRRHYDEGGKKCPLYYVEHEDAWEQFLKDLRDYIMEDKV